jgi:pimeloyl-ACP methyl ester carboxylesterase
MTIRSRFVGGINGLNIHLLEAGFEAPGRPCLLLLHGFPELAYSWRKVMEPLAAAGFHVVAPDQRGYGRTTGWDGRYDGELSPFGMRNLVADASQLVAALGHRSVAAVIGHDFGAPVAAYAALTRPEIFASVALMSAPFAGAVAGVSDPKIHRELASLERPRKHYQWYYSTREADEDMRRAPQGLHAFLRAYYHYKSADWKANRPMPLASWSAAELAKLPAYYIMELDKNMAETVAPEMPSAAAIAGCRWLPDAELAVYAQAYERTGFQGGLQWYRCATSGLNAAQLGEHAGRRIEVPACFIAGKSDWGTYQKPGEFERMQSTACARMLGCHLVEGAGHWVQQEQPEKVVELLLGFIGSVERRAA